MARYNVVSFEGILVSIDDREGIYDRAFGEGMGVSRGEAELASRVSRLDGAGVAGRPVAKPTKFACRYLAQSTQSRTSPTDQERFTANIGESGSGR